MNLDDLLTRYFGVATIDDLTPGARAAGAERMLVDLGLMRDRGQRFALWSLLHMLDTAPDLDIAFPDPADRDAARNFMDLLATAEERAAR